MLRTMRALAALVCLSLAACGGGTAVPASTPNLQATVEAAVQATTAVQPAPPVVPTPPPTLAATTAPPTPIPTAVPKAPAATPTEWVVNGVRVRKADCKAGDLCLSADETVAVRATEVRTSDTTGNQFVKPGPGNTYLLVNVAVGNFGKGALAYNPLYAKVKDASGREYPSNVMATASLTGSLQTGSLPPNDTVQGVVVFEVPSGARGFRLTYQPLVFPQPAPVVIDLGQ